jgi:hypothetical protein
VPPSRLSRLLRVAQSAIGLSDQPPYVGRLLAALALRMRYAETAAL